MQNNTKSSAVAGVLGVFLGAFGGHDWYLGNTKKAITHVCLCVGGLILLIIGVILMNLSRDIPVFNMLFVCLVIAAYVILVGNGIWGFIEGVIILMQGDAGLAAKGYQVAPAQTLGGTNMIQQGQQEAAGGTSGTSVAGTGDGAAVAGASAADTAGKMSTSTAEAGNAAETSTAGTGDGAAVAGAEKGSMNDGATGAQVAATDAKVISPVQPTVGQTEATSGTNPAVAQTSAGVSPLTTDAPVDAKPAVSGTPVEVKAETPEVPKVSVESVAPEVPKAPEFKGEAPAAVQTAPVSQTPSASQTNSDSSSTPAGQSM